MSVLRGFIYLALFGVALGDVYMHNPRGNNNRLNEQDANAQNQNRLFDSQNNAKGGYCTNINGQNGAKLMEYVEGSILPIEWTNQHSCGGEKGTCNMVLQYMCTDGNAADATIIRDGTTTDSIQNQGANGPTARDTANGNNLKFGMNENKTYYDNAKQRDRNKGLFIADQNVQATAQSTRQNPNGAGNTHGYEIAEERDYYPYWHPSPWKDIAVLTDDTSLCAFYQAESGNVKAKNLCTVPKYNNEAECTANGGQFVSVPPPAGLTAPACVQTDFTRDNHLGNSVDGATPSYTWVLPRVAQEPCAATAAGCACVLRLRYNISTGENNAVTGKFLDSTNNAQLKNDPTVQVDGANLQLAINTAQFGRTFQDRSYTFKIVNRPADVAADTKIYNLNVRGKRGNIVQVYPAVEYDFVPNDLTVNQGDIINPQWTGCDNNPAGNEGEGTDQTDRSNIVQIANQNSNLPINASTNLNPLFETAALRKRLASVGVNNVQNKLNNAPVTFNAGLIRMNNTGTYAYMSTRNNNFSNRSQKGELTVQAGGPNSGAIAAIVAGSVAGAGALAGGVIMLL